MPWGDWQNIPDYRDGYQDPHKSGIARLGSKGSLMPKAFNQTAERTADMGNRVLSPIASAWIDPGLKVMGNKGPLGNIATFIKNKPLDAAAVAAAMYFSAGAASGAVGAGGGVAGAGSAAAAAPAASVGAGSAAAGGAGSLGAAGSAAITPAFSSLGAGLASSGAGAGTAGSISGSLLGAGGSAALTPAFSSLGAGLAASGAGAGMAGAAGAGTLGSAGTAAGSSLLTPAATGSAGFGGVGGTTAPGMFSSFGEGASSLLSSAKDVLGPVQKAYKFGSRLNDLQESENAMEANRAKMQELQLMSRIEDENKLSIEQRRKEKIKRISNAINFNRFNKIGYGNANNY